MKRRPILISVMQFEDEIKRSLLSIEDVLAIAARLGTDGLEIRPELWRDKASELPFVRDAAQAAGQLLTYATTNTFFSADPAGPERLRQDIADAHALGATLLRVFSGPLPAPDDTAGWAAGVALAAHAAAHGVKLALENYAWSPGGTMAEIGAVLAHIPADHMGTNVDIANYSRHGEDILVAIERFGSRALYAHLKDQGGPPDWPNYPLGDGMLHLNGIMAALDRLPQPLTYCFEFRGGGDPEGRITRSLNYLHTRGWLA